jgi:DNA-binding response OmpR family regulator
LINVYSEPGRGTTLKIYIPRVTGEVPIETNLPAASAGGGRETVLLVEDEEQILRLGRRILERLGYTVLTAATPEAALAAAERHAAPIELLITDVVMPGMNGRVLRDKLRQSRPAMGCLLMSGYTADVIAHHGVLDEGMDFLQKPFTTHALTEKVRAVLDRAKTGASNR